METQLTDITPQSTPPTTSSPPPTSPQSPHAPDNFTDDRDDTLLPATRKLRNFFLGIPIISLVVGGVLLIAEVAIIILVLAAPRTVGISEDAALTRAQRGVLGAVSVLMLVEAVLLGIIDIGTCTCIYKYPLPTAPVLKAGQPGVPCYMYVYRYTCTVRVHIHVHVRLSYGWVGYITLPFFSFSFLKASVLCTRASMLYMYMYM